MPADQLFPNDDDELMKSLYARQGRTLDDLPYTPQFEAIASAMEADSSNADRARLFRRLHNLRKAAKLPRLGKAAEQPPRVAPEHENLLVDIVVADLGQLSLRDQLPYTDAFDRIVAGFNSRAGLSLSPHDVWRIVAKLAK